MKGTRMWGVAAIVALSSGTIAATGLTAQAATTLDDNARAAALVEKAEELSKNQEKFDAAASNYRMAAEIHRGELAAVEPLRMAGRLAFYMGDTGRAYRDFVRAAETALEWGDVVTAANTFLDAAWIAREARRPERASDMLRRAEKLSHSPLIAAADRHDLQRRITEPQ